MSDPGAPVLGDLRVVELSTGIGGAYAAKLFVDAGADVVKVEPPGGDPLRRWSASGAALGGRDGGLFAFLNASKRSVVGGLGEAAVTDLIAGADIVVENFAPGVIEATGLLDQPGLVTLSLSPWGRGGPLTGRPATEFMVQAECGSLAARGRATPTQAGGFIAHWAAGIFGAPAALAAVDEARATGEAVHIDVSEVEAMCVCTNLFSDLMFSMLGRPPLPGPARVLETPSIEPTADGWVGFNTNAAQMFQDFLLLVGRPDLAEDPVLGTAHGRIAHLDEWNAIVHAYTTSRTTAEVIKEASELRIPVVPVTNGRTVLDEEHFVARDVFSGPSPTGARVPRPPYKLAGRRPGPAHPRPAPAPGEHTGQIEPRRRPAATPQRRRRGAPFEGLRILDLTCWWAGPSATQFFAALGADVIHVEAIQRPDGMRFAAAYPFVGRDRWWEYSGFFLSINANKRGLTLDLAQPRGLELTKQLIAWADVVVENYTPRVMERFGLDWPAVRTINPGVVLARMPAFGLDGPWRDRPGFAQNMEQMSGLAWITGFPKDPPLIPKGPCDPLGGMHAAFAIQVALASRRETGEGMLVEIPLIESALNLAAEQVIEYTAYGAVLERDGNRSPGLAPQGVYACRGTEQWVAISVGTDEQWWALAEALGSPAWTRDPILGTYAGRRSAHDRLDAELGRWAAEREISEVVETLAAHGVPVAALADPRTISLQPHMAARGLFEDCDHEVVGRQPLMGLPFRWSGVDRWIRTPGPTMGQHNVEILRDILGLDAAAIAALADAGVIGDRPVGV